VLKNKPCYALGVVLLMMILGSPAQADLMAPVYPGAVSANEELTWYEPYFEEAYYVREPVEEVVAFYEQEFGPMEEVRAGEKYRNVRRQAPRFLASAEPENIGVRVYAKAAAEQLPADTGRMTPEQAARIKEVSPGQCASGHFAGLRLIAQQHDSYDWQDFQAVCDGFEHIDRAYFQLTDEKDERGRYQRKDQVLLAQQRKNMGMMTTEQREASAEDMSRRIQELQQQGRMQEMAEVARQFQEQSMAGTGVRPGGEVQDNWDEWVAYLERLDGYAFQTMIRINRDPSAWPEERLQHPDDR